MAVGIKIHNALISLYTFIIIKINSIYIKNTKNKTLLKSIKLNA